MKFVVQLVEVTLVCLYYFLLNSHFFGSSRSAEVLLGEGVLKVCTGFVWECPCRGAILVKLQSNFIEITLRHGCSPVGLLCVFGVPFFESTSARLLLLFYFAINPRGEIRIQLDVSLWSLAR